MKKQPGYFLVLLAVAAISFASCKNNADYKKTKSGIMYKIFSDGKNPLIKPGNTIKINFTIKIGSTDSVLQTSVGKAPAYIPVQADVPDNAYSQVEVFGMLRKGDSAVIVQMIDTMAKKSQQPLPPFLKKGDRLLTIVKVIDVFTTPDASTKDKEAESAKEKIRIENERDSDLVKGNADMVAWLASKNINAVKTGKGTYVIIKNPGTGMLADSGKYVTVRFEGKTLSDGKVFQTTMDSTAQPFSFKVGTGGAIPGWDEGIPLFKKGGKGTLYIPGALGYGRYPPQGSPFKLNEPMIFDIYVVDVSDTQPAQQQQQLPPQIREQMQKQMQQRMQQQQQQKPAH